MAVGSETVWHKFLQPFLQPVIRLLIDEVELDRLYESIDWERESDRFRNPQLVYPPYYEQQNLYGIEGGYLNPKMAISYDSRTQYFLPPQETLVRQGLLDRLQGTPQRILDLGCGTGTSTLMLQQKFPQASITGLDLSPYMLVMANNKSKQAGLNIHWQQGNAEHTGFPIGYFDLVTASLLFQETPTLISQAIIKEGFRLLKGGGQLIILDSSQQILRQIDSLSEVVEDLFREPIEGTDPTDGTERNNYAAGSLDAWFGAAGFEAVRTHHLWLVHQITSGFKPSPVQDRWAYPGMEVNDFLGGFAAIGA